MEYRLVEAFIKRELDRRFGYAQVFGCLLITLYGVLAILGATSAGRGTPPGLSERVLLLLAVIGEAVFVFNIVYTYRAEQTGLTIRQPASSALAIRSNKTNQVRPRSEKGLRLSGNWQNSPVAMFGIAAAFFALMGMFFARVGFLTSRVPVGWNGTVTQVPAGYLCASTALPFAMFAVVYLILEQRFGMDFALTPTRAHFICTLLAVLETIHVYMGWAENWANPSSLNTPVTASDFGGALAFGALACGCFVWNVVASSATEPPA
jgi:hypothetical protein